MTPKWVLYSVNRDLIWRQKLLWSLLPLTHYALTAQKALGELPLPSRVRELVRPTRYKLMKFSLEPMRKVKADEL